MGYLCQLFYKQGAMIIDTPENLQSQVFLRMFDKNTNYGNKLIKFSQEISKMFDKIIKIGVKPKKDQKLKESSARSAVLFTSIILRKIYKKQFQNYDPQQFVGRLKNKSEQVCQQTKRDQQSYNYIVNPVCEAVNHIQRLISFKDILFFEDLMKSVISKKQLKLNQEDLNNIQLFFNQTIVFMNYDDNKQAYQNVIVSDKNIYLLKAKDQYFILIKSPQIVVASQEQISADQLLSIFNIESKPSQDSESKKYSDQKTIGSQINQQAKQQNETDSIKKYQSYVKNNTTGSPSRSDIRSSIKQNTMLFPDQVKCSICNKSNSQFNALFWNYSHVCFQCIILPQVDVSFIPPGLIQKFLKSHKQETKQYHIICPECKSQTFLTNYRPWDKPKKYKCRACLKVICIEHQSHINSCFCFCLQCDKQTISVSKIFVKYCISCRTRSCQICNSKGKTECTCICKICGQNQLVDHQECKKRCYACLAFFENLQTNQNGKKLCIICLFKSFQPNSNID